MASRRERVRRYQKKSRTQAKHNQELRDRDNKIHELEQRLLFAERPFQSKIERLTLEHDKLQRDIETLKATAQHMLLWCPSCGERHYDEGEFATKEHHTHACQHCGMVWRPAIGPTFGVRFLPGFKNREEAAELLRRLGELRDGIAVVGHDDRPKAILDELIGLVKK